MPCCGRPLCQHFHQFHQFHQCPRWRFSTGRCPAACQAAWPLPLSRGAKGCTQNSACGAGVEGPLRKMRPGERHLKSERISKGEAWRRPNIIGKNWIWLWIWIHNNPWFDSSLWSLPCFSILFALVPWSGEGALCPMDAVIIYHDLPQPGYPAGCWRRRQMCGLHQWPWKGCLDLQWKFGGVKNHPQNKQAECSWGGTQIHQGVLWCF